MVFAVRGVGCAVWVLVLGHPRHWAVLAVGRGRWWVMFTVGMGLWWAAFAVGRGSWWAVFVVHRVSVGADSGPLSSFVGAGSWGGAGPCLPFVGWCW